MEANSPTPPIHDTCALKCAGCGAIVMFEAGTEHLKCAYCGTENELPMERDIRSTYSYQEFLEGLKGGNEALAGTVVKCDNCGATVDLPTSVTSDICPFCASPVVLSMAANVRILRPHSILPFVVKKEDATAELGKWAGKLWFAPSDLAKSIANPANRLQGVYVPHWCYDSDTITEYRGERGEYYYETETYTYTENGQTKTGTRQVRYTRWYNVSGRVSNNFHDVLISASPSLPQQVTVVLEPWPLQDLVLFEDSYLSGFRSETYQKDAKTAYNEMTQMVRPTIEDTIRYDIGGDEQRVGRYHTQHYNTALRYILLPVWICAYRHKDTSYQITVNACTGEVTGDRPYSALKIFTAAILIAAAILGICYWFVHRTPSYP